METSPAVIHRPRSFLSNLALGLSAIVITATLSCAGIIVYGLNIADRKSEGVVDLFEQAVRGLPEFRKSLPPALADLFNDRRQPAYVANLKIETRLAPDREGTYRPIIEVENTGSDVVTLLSLRVVLLDGDGVPVNVWHDWGATPIQAEDPEWRGPLLPGSTRVIVESSRLLGRARDPGSSRLDVEITDVRVWDDPARGRLLGVEF